MSLTSNALFVEYVLFIAFVRETHKEFDQVHKGTPRERVLVATSLVPKIGVSFVVKHFVSSQVHASVENLQKGKLI